MAEFIGRGLEILPACTSCRVQIGVQHEPLYFGGSSKPKSILIAVQAAAPKMLSLGFELDEAESKRPLGLAKI